MIEGIVIKKLHKEAAAMKVSAAVRVFIEDNPNFTKPVKLRVLTFKGGPLENLNNEELLDVTCLNALQSKSVQSNAKRLIRTSFRNFKIDFELSDKDAHVILS